MMSARWMKDAEDEIVRMATARQDDQHVRAWEKSLTDAIEKYEQANGFQLSDEQKNAAKFVACDTGSFACITGQAGIGMTTLHQILKT